MTDTQIWLAILILGVLIYMTGTLIPERVITIVGAVITLIGGIGWFILSLN